MAYLKQAPLSIFRAISMLTVLFVVVMTITANPAAAAEEKAASEDDRFFDIQPLSVSVIQNNRVVGYLSVSYQLMLVDLDAATQVTNLKPRLNDASIKVMARIARTRLDVSRPLNIELIQTYLQRTVDQVLGEDIATVLIQSASLQPR